jgi:hypothetical protein
MDKPEFEVQIKNVMDGHGGVCELREAVMIAGNESGLIGSGGAPASQIRHGFVGALA